MHQTHFCFVSEELEIVMEAYKETYENHAEMTEFLDHMTRFYNITNEELNLKRWASI
jgi:hypothetical protein